MLQEIFHMHENKVAMGPILLLNAICLRKRKNAVTFKSALNWDASCNAADLKETCSQQADLFQCNTRKGLLFLCPMQ